MAIADHFIDAARAVNAIEVVNRESGGITSDGSSAELPLLALRVT